MNKEYLIQLTNNLYRLTLLFPKKEPLRYKMRELADEILANCLSSTPNPKLVKNSSWPILLEDLEALDGFFEVAKGQNWVSPVQILEVQEEYSKIREGLKQFSEIVTRKIHIEGVRKDPIVRVSPRQEKIIEILKEKGRAQVWEIKQIFPEVTKRTLRRDFEFLLKQGKIERIGERNNTFYLPRRPASPEPQQGAQMS